MIRIKNPGTYTVYPLDQSLNRVWFVHYYDTAGRPAKKYGKLAKCTTLAEKLAESQRIIDELKQPGVADAKRRESLILHLSELLEKRRARLEETSAKTYFSILRKFAEWYNLAYRENKKVNPGDFINHLYEKKYGNATIRKSLFLLKDLFDKLMKEYGYVKNPFTDIQVKKVKGKSKLPFNPEQINILRPLIQSESMQLWDACQFLFYTFVRPKELRLLRIRDILFYEWKLCVGADIAKDDDEMMKAIPMPMRPLMDQYRNYPGDYYIFSKGGKPGPELLSRDYLSKQHAAIIKKLRWGHRYSFYSWVHTGIKTAALAGIPLKQLQLQKGHHDLEMFNQYMKDLGIDDCWQLANNFPVL